jgi:DNA invertase Pin-like site-specific DNA recombinase
MSKKYAYLRVSSDDQTLDRQRSIFKSHNIEVDEWFEEKASAKNANRKQLNRLLATLREGDTVYVTDQDRLSRKLLDFLQISVKIHEEIKANLHIINSSKSFIAGKEMNVSDQFAVNILAAAAEYERKIIEQRRLESRDKYLAAMAKAKAEGKFKGNPKPQITPQQIREIEAMVKAKVSLRNIAKLTGVALLTAFNYSKKFKQSCTEQHSQPSQHEEALK